MADTGWFDRKALAQIVDAHESGARDNSTPLWTLLMFDTFLRHAACDATPAAAPRIAEASQS